MEFVLSNNISARSGRTRGDDGKEGRLAVDHRHEDPSEPFTHFDPEDIDNAEGIVRFAGFRTRFEPGEGFCVD